MALAIVWRNPTPPISCKQTVRRIRSDQEYAVYVVTDSDGTQQFKLISGQAA